MNNNEQNIYLEIKTIFIWGALILTSTRAVIRIIPTTSENCYDLVLQYLSRLRNQTIVSDVEPPLSFSETVLDDVSLRRKISLLNVLPRRPN